MKLSELVFETKVTLVEESTPGTGMVSGVLPMADDKYRIMISKPGERFPYKFIDFSNEDNAKTAKTRLDKIAKANRGSAAAFETALSRLGKKVGFVVSDVPAGMFKKSKATFKTLAEVEAYAKTPKGKQSFAGKLLKAPAWFIIKSLNAAGLVTASWLGVFAAARDVDEDPSLSADEKQERINILYGLLATETAAMIAIAMRNAKNIKAILNGVKLAVRTAQGAAGATGALTIPAIVSFLITEAGFLAATAALANPNVQRQLAEWISEWTIASFAMALLGSVVRGPVDAAANLLDNTIGETAFGQAVKEFFGFDEEQTRGGREGDYYASTDWAKLTFAHLIFPEASKPQLVPYIPPGRRESLLQKQLKLINEDNTVPSASSEPGLPENPDAPGSTTTAKPNPRQGYESGQDAQQSNPSYIN